MTNNTIKPIIKKPASPFGDPHNNRGGKGGKKGSVAISSGGSHKMKPISVPKFKGGSGGDR